MTGAPLIGEASGSDQQDQRGDVHLRGDGGHGRANVTGGQAGQTTCSLLQGDTGCDADRTVLERTGGIGSLHLHQELAASNGFGYAGEGYQSRPTCSQIDAKSGINDRQQFTIAPQASWTTSQFLPIKLAFERGHVILYAERFMQGVLLTRPGTGSAGTAMGRNLATTCLTYTFPIHWTKTLSGSPDTLQKSKVRLFFCEPGATLCVYSENRRVNRCTITPSKSRVEGGA